MAEPIEYRRIFQKVDTFDGWMANPLILGDGEQAFVRGGGVILNFRMGDGTKRFSELPNVIQYDQAAYVAPSGNTLPVPQNGVGYSILTAGTYNSGSIVVPANNIGIADYIGNGWTVRNMVLPSTSLGPGGAASYETVKSVTDFLSDSINPNINEFDLLSGWMNGRVMLVNGDTVDSAIMSMKRIQLAGLTKITVKGLSLSFADPNDQQAVKNIYGYNPGTGAFATLVNSRVGDRVSLDEELEVAAYTQIIVNQKTADIPTKPQSITYASSATGLTLDEYVDNRVLNYLSEAGAWASYKTDKYDLSWTSFLGVKKININESFREGTQQQRIQQALDFAEGRGYTLILSRDTVLNSDTWNIESSLLIGANTALIEAPGVGIKFYKNGVVDTIIRSKNIQTIPGAGLHSPDYMTGRLRAERIENIIILGSGVNSSRIEGSDVAYRAPRPNNPSDVQNWASDEYGWRCISVLMTNVKNVSIGGYTLSKTKAWGNVLEHCENFYVHDINIDSQGVLNGDGVDILAGSVGGLVRDIGGVMQDDIVFVGNVPRTNLVFPNEKYIYPMFAMFNDLKDQPISFQNTHSVDVDNIHGHSWSVPVRVMATTGNEVYNVDVNNVDHKMGPYTNGFCIVALQNSYDLGGNGVVRDVTVNNVRGWFGSATGYSVYIEPGIDVKNNKINDIRRDGGRPATNTGYNPSNIVTNII